MPGRNVDVIEQVLAHPAMMALQLVGLHAVKFIEHESDDCEKSRPSSRCIRTNSR